MRNILPSRTINKVGVWKNLTIEDLFIITFIFVVTRVVVFNVYLNVLHLAGSFVAFSILVHIRITKRKGYISDTMKTFYKSTLKRLW